MVGTGNLNGHHVVQFYGRDEDLTGSVADYLRGALQSGGVAVVIATAEHQRAFEERMAEAGVDLSAAAASGTYLAFDARETVRQFMAADRPDSADFDRVIGGLIARVCRPGRPVRAYGEMVALLWDDGLVNAAVQLEELWNSLGRRYAFSLYCGYPAQAVASDGHVDAFAQVCRLHREVISTPSAAALQGAPGVLRTFGFTLEAPAAARRFAVGAIESWGAGDMAGDVALVVTELAANAILHAHTGFTLAVSVQDDRLRISVRDGSPLDTASGAGRALPAAPLHGLGAVDAMACRWGITPLGTEGKEVWVELRR